jgi:hypothetical protein
MSLSIARVVNCSEVQEFEFEESRLNLCLSRS